MTSTSVEPSSSIPLLSNNKNTLQIEKQPQQQQSLLDIGYEMVEQRKRRRNRLLSEADGEVCLLDSSSSSEPLLKRQRIIVTATTKKKNVHFAPMTTTYVYTRDLTTNGAEDSTTIAQQQIWYNPSDFKRFSEECRLTLQLLDDVNGDLEKLLQELPATHKDLICTRGLEHQIDQTVFQAKKHRQQQLLRMVLYQQHLYRETGKAINPERMRDISLMFSKEAIEWAIEIGSQ